MLRPKYNGKLEETLGDVPAAGGDQLMCHEDLGNMMESILPEMQLSEQMNWSEKHFLGHRFETQTKTISVSDSDALSSK